MEKTNRHCRVVITGPESTGKTELARALALKYNAIYEPEIARSYVEKLDRKYTFADVEQIARLQINCQQQHLSNNSGLVFFDTGLIITKVWFDVVYNKCPNWLIDAIRQLPIDMYLLCSPDLPWIPDTVRENGGQMRVKLFDIYKQQLHFFNCNYSVVNGFAGQRINNAVKTLKLYLPHYNW